ncbi:MAG TPA: hypothetical protein VHM70_25470 [Polyangiaceae bacterium]|jgi:hypothetical protein|nr:hypothetical protein [Polyangiaceae bacterium]
MLIGNRWFAYLVLLIMASGCAGAPAPQMDETDELGEAATLLQNDLPAHVSAVAVNVNGAHWTWAFVRGTGVSGTLVSKRRSHATGAWDSLWTTQGSCCVVGRPLATVWKQASGNDKIVVYLLQTDQNIWSLTIDPSVSSTGTFENISAAAGLAPGQFPMIHSAVTTGSGASRKVNLVVADTSNRLYTLDFNDLGATGWGLHTVLNAAGAQVNTRGYPATLSLDAQQLAGRNTLSNGNEALVWKASRGAAHFAVDWTASTPGGGGLPVPGRFASGQSGSLVEGVYYRGASTSLLTRATTSLCTSKQALGSVTANTHAVVIASLDASQLIINGLPGSCQSSAQASSSAPVLSDNSQLTGWSQANDGTGDVFYRSASGSTLMTCFFKNGLCGNITDLNYQPGMGL